ncbi:hypothetical protein V8G54_023962 [Vigna mungo]|uniref:Retrovirus-related Pol polyprotein from transposon TNT 1-94-like beta-barrel domain-containing protein n=1 Tax=Vigna mungo TaxID=3915 RepID=A0AAQ3N6C1_VIGMU
MDDAQAIWNDLKSRFFQGELLRISELQREVASLKQGTYTGSEVYTKLRTIWDEHSVAIPSGLNEQYGNIQFHVLLLDPIPPFAKIFFLCHATGKTNGHTDAVCFKKHGFLAKPLPNKKACSRCGKTGHTVDVCYRKHGYPPGHKFYNGKSLLSRSQEPTNESLRDNSESEVRLTKQQYQSIMDLINSTTATTPTPQFGSMTSNSPDPGKTILTFDFAAATSITTWILDSGATDHVVSSLKYFHSYDPIKPVTINLPNGITTNANHKGTIKLCDTICLADVLYIPDFSYNLISISKMVLHNNVYVTFTNSQCFIQESTTNHKIGPADLHAGLYVPHSHNLTTTPCVHFAST